MVKNSMEPRQGTGHKKAGAAGGTRLVADAGVQPAGRFIWQLVGVLDTYGSICLMGTNV
ncbi:MAG TPA: hypothetical protein VEA35_08700 [Ramlibacter sp.]|nr:hypothetical protein [Ramlibacter sp.]